MRRFAETLCIALVALLLSPSAVSADEEAVDATSTPAESLVRITLLRLGGGHQVQSVSGTSTSSSSCDWSSVPAQSAGLGDVIQVPDAPGADQQWVLYSLFCNGNFYGNVWVGPEDIVDVDAAIQAEAERYVRDVLAPVVRIGVNPSAQGLVGLASWFWIEGFSGSVAAPPISAFGMTVDVRMTSGTVTWDFGDGTIEDGDLGRAYPEESSVQHRFQRHGTYDVTAQIDLVPEYSVNGGPWLTLPDLSVSAAATHPVEQRQPVLTNR